MKTKLYVGHALTNASKQFASRMVLFRDTLKRMSSVELLDYNWTPGKGPDPKIDTYPHDMDRVARADLAVFVLDEVAYGVAMEFQERCRLGKPLRCFQPKGVPLTGIVPSCLRHFRTIYGPMAELPDPVEYDADSEYAANRHMVEVISKWVHAHQLAQRKAPQLALAGCP